MSASIEGARAEIACILDGTEPLELAEPCFEVQRLERLYRATGEPLAYGMRIEVITYHVAIWRSCEDRVRPWVREDSMEAALLSAYRKLAQLAAEVAADTEPPRAAPIDGYPFTGHRTMGEVIAADAVPGPA